MATAYGKVHVVLGETPPTITMYKNVTGTATSLGSAYVNPDFDEASISVGFTTKEQAAASGEIDSVRFYGEYLEATFQIRPKAATIADALKAATIPGAGFHFTVSGMAVIAAGSFSDALNCSTSNGPWFVQPGAALRGPSTDAATISVTARRYPGITSNAIVDETA